MPIRVQVSTEVLRKLHRIHRQLTDLRERLQRGPRQIHAREVNIARQEELLAQAQSEFKAFRVATDAKQLQLKSKEDKVKEWRLKLNTATSNREYQILKDQIAADEMANSVLAAEILAGLEKLDAMQAQVQEQAANVAKAREETAKVQKDVQEHDPVLHADLARLEAELAECEAALPAELRDAYQRIVRQKGEDGLAPVAERVEDGADEYYCGGCNQHLPLNLYNAMRMSQPVFCKSCGCLLYIPE